MKKSAFYLDVLFLFFGAFLFFVCLLRAFSLPLLPSVVASVLLALSVDTCFYAFCHKKHGNVAIKKRETERQRNAFFALALLPKKAVAERLLQAFLKAETSAKLKRYGSIYAVATNAYTVFPIFSVCPVTARELNEIYRIKTAKRKQVFVAEMDESAWEFAKRVGLAVRSSDQTYAFFKANDALPCENETPARLRKNPFKRALQKTNGKRFFLSGILVVACSFLTPFRVYYLLVGSILILLAIVLRFASKASDETQVEYT